MMVLYLIVLAALILLLTAARGEILFSEQEVPAVLRPVRRSAVWLYRRIRRAAVITRRRGRGELPGREAVEKNLSLLDPSRGGGKRVALYYIDKIQNLILFIAIADVLAMAVWYSERQEGVLSEEGSIVRPDYGESSLDVSVTAFSGEDDSPVGEYSVSVGALQYSEEETQAMAQQLFEQLPDMILGENLFLSHVTMDLELITQADGYPFRISWSSSRNAWIDSEGHVQSDLVEEETGVAVTLTALLSYEDREYEESYEVRVYPKSLTQEESLAEELQEALNASEEASSQERVYQLPGEINGIAISWEETIEDNSLLLFGLVVAAGVLVFQLSDRDLRDRVRKRERQMAVDYPQIVSKLVLFLGAGMSVRNAFARLGDSYVEKRKKGGDRHYVYEEILLVCRELDSGVSESNALAHFGRRCGTRQYTRLCSLLVQNLSKGNSALLSILQEEADLAFEERKSLARQMGEEAGTKLLLPMILMLGVTLIIIMIPAYLSFT